MGDKKSQEESEKPAKVYQVDALHTEIVAVKKLLEDQNTYIKGAASVEYVEGRFVTIKEWVSTEIKLVKAEYRPVLGNARWAARTSIAAFVSIILMIIGIYLKSK